MTIHPLVQSPSEGLKLHIDSIFGACYSIMAIGEIVDFELPGTVFFFLIG